MGLPLPPCWPVHAPHTAFLHTRKRTAATAVATSLTAPRRDAPACQQGAARALTCMSRSRCKHFHRAQVRCAAMLASCRACVANSSCTALHSALTRWSIRPAACPAYARTHVVQTLQATSPRSGAGPSHAGELPRARVRGKEIHRAHARGAAMPASCRARACVANSSCTNSNSSRTTMLARLASFSVVCRPQSAVLRSPRRNAGGKSGRVVSVRFPRHTPQTLNALNAVPSEPDNSAKHNHQHTLYQQRTPCSSSSSPPAASRCAY
jgi:hypothetical protein